MVLDYVALGVIIFLMIGATAVIVVLGSLPGNIARKRNHPWPAAVTAAGWIGMVTAVFWPLALIWAFLPVPNRNDGSGETNPAGDDTQHLRRQIADLESAVAKLESQAGDDK